MLKSRPDMPTHLILAIEHHRQLVEDAQRHRKQLMGRKALHAQAALRQGVRGQVGDWLINLGQRLKDGDGRPDASNAAWG
jgi:hypothetical protein